LGVARWRAAPPCQPPAASNLKENAEIPQYRLVLAAEDQGNLDAVGSAPPRGTGRAPGARVDSGLHHQLNLLRVRHDLYLELFQRVDGSENGRLSAVRIN
jgi:hypothetical protein